MSKEKGLITFLIIVLGLDILAIGLLSYQNQKLKDQLAQLEKQLAIIQEENKKLSQSNTISPKNIENLKPLPHFSIPQFDENIDPFEEMRKFEQQMNQLFSQLDQNFSNRFEINITPKGGSYLHFSNTQIINGKKFSYNIDVIGNKIKGKIIYDRLETLKQIQDKLKNLGLETKLEGNTLKFWGENVDINKVLNLFNINFEENNIENPYQNGIRWF